MKGEIQMRHQQQPTKGKEATSQRFVVAASAGIVRHRCCDCGTEWAMVAGAATPSLVRPSLEPAQPDKLGKGPST